MSLSRVIRPSSGNTEQDEILTAHREESEENLGDGFQTLESLWKDRDGNVATLAGPQEQKKLLLKEAETIVAQAKSQASQVEEDAYKKGYEAGFDAGQEEMRARVAEVAAFLQTVEKERQTLYRQYEEDALELVKVLLEKLVNHEVSVNPKVIGACLRKSLSYVVENSQVKVHLNSLDFGRLKEAAMEDPNILGGFRQLELIEDQSIAVGGCLIETEYGEIDATIEKRKKKLFDTIDKVFLQSLAASDS